MRRKHVARPYDDLNVTPLLDLAWVLLLVFIIMATATVQGISVALPRAANSPSLARPHTHAVTVTADGRIYVDTTEVTLTELQTRLAQIKALDPDVPIVVKGDAAVHYDAVIAVLDVVKTLKITNVGLVTQRLVR
ncbi:MAG: ExbD/TolR family protein [Steroidobacteraceae bacterium]|jgi:biopolymer transport protein ExbD